MVKRSFVFQRHFILAQTRSKGQAKRIVRPAYSTNGCDNAFRVVAVALSMLAAGWLSACQAAPSGLTTQPDPNLIDTEQATVNPSTALVEPELQSTPTDTPVPTTTPTHTPSPTPIPIEWQTLAPGIEFARVNAPIEGTSEYSIVVAYRIVPRWVDFRVHYDPVPHTIDEWQTLSGADIVINGGFFTGGYAPMGRIVTDGVLYGAPLDYGDDSIGVPGLFAVTGDIAEIYALGHESYTPRGMRFDQALESYPILLLPGGQPTFGVDTGFVARRTVIGIDEDRNVLILVSSVNLFTLNSLAEWLPHSGLQLDMALNLDGGRSTGLAANVAGNALLIESYVPLPIVLAVYTR